MVLCSAARLAVLAAAASVPAPPLVTVWKLMLCSVAGLSVRSTLASSLVAVWKVVVCSSARLPVLAAAAGSTLAPPVVAVWKVVVCFAGRLPVLAAAAGSTLVSSLVVVWKVMVCFCSIARQAARSILHSPLVAACGSSPLLVRWESRIRRNQPLTCCAITTEASVCELKL